MEWFNTSSYFSGILVSPSLDQSLGMEKQLNSLVTLPNLLWVLQEAAQAREELRVSIHPGRVCLMFNSLHEGTFAETAQDGVGLLLWHDVNHPEKRLLQGIWGEGEEEEEGSRAPHVPCWLWRWHCPAEGVQGTTDALGTPGWSLASLAVGFSLFWFALSILPTSKQKSLHGLDS